MTFPMITADERLAEPRGVKGVLLGKSGIGKTSQLWTLSPASTLFFDLEAGDLAVEHEYQRQAKQLLGRYGKNVDLSRLDGMISTDMAKGGHSPAYRSPLRGRGKKKIYEVIFLCYDYVLQNVIQKIEVSMQQETTESKAKTLTFRVSSELKKDFSRIAKSEAKPVGELLRELVRSCVARKHRQQFEAEARRQSMEAASVACDSFSDEAKVMCEMEADLKEFANEWK